MIDTSMPDKLDGIIQKVDQLPQKMLDTSMLDKLEEIMQRVEQMSQKMLEISMPDKLEDIMQKVEQFPQMLDTSVVEKLEFTTCKLEHSMERLGCSESMSQPYNRKGWGSIPTRARVPWIGRL